MKNNRQAIASTRSHYPPGSRGTVHCVDDMGTIHMRWDNGSSLGLVPGEDSFRKLTMAEIEAEQDMGGMQWQTM